MNLSLTLVTLSPLNGILVSLFMSDNNRNDMRWAALITSLLTFGVSIWVFTMFNASNPNLQLVEKYNWITVAGWNIQYHLGVDGLSILLILLTTFLTPISILSTWTAVEERVKELIWKKIVLSSSLKNRRSLNLTMRWRGCTSLAHRFGMFP